MKDKISETEAMLDILNDIFDMTSTNETAKKLVAYNIHSFDDFKYQIYQQAKIFAEFE